MRRILLSLCVAALAACTSTAPRFEADPSVDLKALDRFVWSPSPRDTPPVHALDSEIFEKRVRTAATADLVARGFVVDEQAPEFRLGARLVVDAGAKPAPRVSVGFGVGSFGGRSSSSVSVGGSTSVGEAGDALTLALEVRDAKSGELVWQGWRKLSDKAGDPRSPALADAVRAILADFPVPAGASRKPKR